MLFLLLLRACAADDCSSCMFLLFLHLDFCSMFPEAPPSGLMMLITVTQKTQNNMMYWSSAVEEERELMLGRVSLE